jgi:hypothetical protein
MTGRQGLDAVRNEAKPSCDAAESAPRPANEIEDRARRLGVRDDFRNWLGLGL